MPETATSDRPAITLQINGIALSVPPGTTVAVAVLMAGQAVFRKSVTGEPRGALCGMGICFECRLTIDGQSHLRSCQVTVRPGMDVRSDG